MFARTTFFILSIALLSVPVAAQDVNGTISGIVRDATGSSVPDALIRAVNTGTQVRFEARSDPNGVYALRSIPIGVYDVEVQAPGFKRFEAKRVRLQVNEVARFDPNLEIGAIAESVTVSGEVTPVDTSSSTLKTVVDEKRIQELPLNGRNPTQLMRGVAGVVTDPRADVTSGTTYPGVIPVSVNGSRANATNYVLDGAQNNDHYSNAPNPMPNPDALQEFSVQTNNFSAEFGRQSGGLVNAVTKSGTNNIHGSAFEFVRNNALNAANFFAPIVNGKKKDDGLKRNQFGATLGGPVFIPKAYNGHNKTFFFFSYQGTLERRIPNATSVVVPTAAQRSGDFSGLSRALKDPFRGGTYVGNRILASDISPISLEILKFLPVPTGGNTIFVPQPNNDDDHQFLVRLDHELTGKNRLSGRFWNSSAETPAVLNPNNYLEQNTGRTWLNRSFQITDTHVFGPHLTNQAMVAFNRTDGNNIPVYPPKSLADLGSKIYNDKMTQYHITVNGYWGTLNTGDTNRFLRDEYQIIDTVRWTAGRHQLTLGGEYGRGIGDVVNNFKGNGRFNFNSSAPFTGDSFADFLIGKFNSLEQGVGEYKKTRFNRVAAFAQDSFRMHSRLTLDLGIRWEPYFPFTDVDGKLAAWHPGQHSTRYVNAPAGVLYPGDTGIPAGGVPTTWGNLAPRTGFAWDVFGNGKTSVRGGYGIFFDHANTLMTNNLANQAPFGTVVTIFGNAQNSFADPWAGTTNPFPSSTTPPATYVFPQFSSQTVYSADFRNPYVQAWNLTVERQILGGFFARLSYAGSKGTRLAVMRELNSAVYAPGVTTATTNQRRPLAPALGTISIDEPVGNSTYHALQLTVEKRFSRGFSIRANYQFSKAIDDSSLGKVSGQGRTNPFNQAFDKGPSDFDKTHVFNLSGVWELPIHFQQRLANTLIGGWSLSNIIALWSGYPFTVLSGVDNARTGTGSQRADLVGNPYLPDDRPRGEKVQQWLNRAAFFPNALGTYGNLGRNVFRGPGYASVDFGLFKRFPITERLTATLRFEAFNAFNRVNLAGPSNSITSANFMRTTVAYDPRVLQLAARLVW